MLNTDDMHDFKQCRRNDFWIGGGGKKIVAWQCRAKIFLITLFSQKDTIFFISISVISNIH